MEASESVVGVLLAGGRSSRMGGGDKGLRLLGGRPVLAHVIERLRPQVAAIVINANGDLSRFARFDLPVVADSVEGYAGPLAGIEAGLAWAKLHCPDKSAVVTVATDTPFIPLDLVRRFADARKDASTLLVARSEKGVQPVIGMWPLAMRRKLKQALEQGVRKVGAFVEEHAAVEVSFPPTEIGGRRIDPFFNINRPEDLAEAEALLAVASRQFE
jgi:molybdopterin-guanine dinucleotide biosynthesis protein A